jgi:hypothetical protein
MRDLRQTSMHRNNTVRRLSPKTKGQMITPERRSRLLEGVAAIERLYRDYPDILTLDPRASSHDGRSPNVLCFGDRAAMRAFAAKNQQANWRIQNNCDWIGTLNDVEIDLFSAHKSPSEPDRPVQFPAPEPVTT